MEALRTARPRVVAVACDKAHRPDTWGQVATEALNSVPVGIIVTDEDGRIFHVNRPARELIRRGCGLVMRNEFLSSDARNDAERLREAIRDVVTEAALGRSVRAQALSLHRPEQVHPISITIKPIWCRQNGPASAPLANLCIVDLNQQMVAPADLLQRVFGLTPTESVVLERLVLGLSLQEIADSLGTSRNTVRNQLHVVFEKTATNRQSELIKLVLSTTVWSYSAPNGAPAGLQAPQLV